MHLSRLIFLAKLRCILLHMQFLIVYFGHNKLDIIRSGIYEMLMMVVLMVVMSNLRFDMFVFILVRLTTLLIHYTKK